MTTDGQVLVLNRSWVAVHTTPVRRALCLLYRDLARAVHPEDYSLYDFANWCELSEMRVSGRYLHTPSRRIRIPEAIVLRVFNGFVRREVRFTRRNIFERDKNTCQYCGRHFPKSELSIDHVLPRSRGGRDTWDNVVLACLACNVRKGDRMPDEAHMPLLQRPSKPKWLPPLGGALSRNQFESWQRFIDTAYWDVELKE